MFIYMLEKFMFICGYILHQLDPRLGTKLGFFVVRSTFLLAHAFDRSVSEQPRSRF